MHHKQEHGRVELEGRALEPDAKGDLVEDPAVVQPVGHDAVEDERGGDRGAFKVFALAGGVLGQDGDGDVEAGESGEAAEDEKCEADGISDGSEANGEGDHGGGDTEGDLHQT